MEPSTKRSASDHPQEEAASLNKRLKIKEKTEDTVAAVVDSQVAEDEDEATPGNLTDLFDAHLVGPGSLALQTTSFQDLMRVRQVSTACRDFLRPENKNFWRDLATKQFPSAVSGILADLPDEERANIDFYKLSQGLSRKDNVKPQPTYTLRIEDLLLVVDLYREVKKEDGEWEREKLGTFRRSDCSPWLRGERVLLVKEDPVVFNCLNPLSHKAGAFAENNSSLASYRQEFFDSHFADPVFDVAENQVLVVKNTLFRRDDWRSVSLKAQKPSDDLIGYLGDSSVFDFYDEKIPFAHDWFGAIAHERAKRLLRRFVTEASEFCDIYDRVEIQPILPEPGSADERKWLREMRKGGDWDLTELDKEELASIDCFPFRIEAITSSLELGPGALRSRVRSDDDFMRIVEGFDWQ